MDLITTALTMSLAFIRDLTVVWSPVLLIVALVLVGVQVTKMVRLARTNAATRSARRVADAYRAPVLDITDRLPTATRSNIA